MLGAVAQLERALIAERTKAGMKAAKARGRLAGNPGLRERRPEAVRAIAAARERACLDDLITSAQTWLPTVRRLRPQHSWDDVVRDRKGTAGRSSGCGARCIGWFASASPNPP